MGGVPTLIGEFGLPFDLDDGAAYRTGDFSSHVAALDAYAAAMDANLLSFTLWNYTTDNTNAHGDQWCGEDLSLFSRDQRTNPTDINPAAGDSKASCARMPWPSPACHCRCVRSGHGGPSSSVPRGPAGAAPTEIFVPRLQYAGGYAVTFGRQLRAGRRAPGAGHARPGQ